jgi:hypothetical protein
MDTVGITLIGILLWIIWMRYYRFFCSRKTASLSESPLLPREDGQKAYREALLGSGSRPAERFVPRHKPQNALPQDFGTGSLVASVPNPLPAPIPPLSMAIADVFPQIVSTVTEYIFHPDLHLVER